MGFTTVLEWTGSGQQFRGGRPDGPQVIVDGDNDAGPSPVVMLALALGGCMAIDVLDIAQKSRVPVTALAVETEAERREEPPRRLTSVRLRYIVTGAAAADEPKLWRAIELSRDKYCSVLHSMREDIELKLELELR